MSNFSIDTPYQTERNKGQAIGRGIFGKCPHCGEGKLFSSYLKVAPSCQACGESFTGHRADDAPPYIVIFIVGHIVVALNLIVERASDWPIWIHFVIWPSLTLILCLALLPMVKGALIAYQWAIRIHGFDPKGDYHEKGFYKEEAKKSEPEPAISTPANK